MTHHASPRSIRKSFCVGHALPEPQLQYAPPIVAGPVRTPVDVRDSGTPGTYIVDFGEEFAGFVEFDVHAGAANSTVLVRI